MNLFSHFTFESINTNESKAFERSLKENTYKSEAFEASFQHLCISKVKTILYIPFSICFFYAFSSQFFSQICLMSKSPFLNTKAKTGNLILRAFLSLVLLAECGILFCGLKHNIPSVNEEGITHEN